MVEKLRRNIVDVAFEKSTVGKYGQTVKIIRGVPIYYSRDGVEPAAESDGVPTKEVQRRDKLAFRANVLRLFGR